MTSSSAPPSLDKVPSSISSSEPSPSEEPIMSLWLDLAELLSAKPICGDATLLGPGASGSKGVVETISFPELAAAYKS